MQRKYWWETPWYRKPVFIKQPIDYWHDMHRYAESYPFLDTKLTLIHLKYIDYEQLWRRNLKSVAEGNFSEHVIAENVSPHNRISDKNEFDKFFKSNFDKRVPIPRCFKEVCWFLSFAPFTPTVPVVEHIFLFINVETAAVNSMLIFKMKRHFIVYWKKYIFISVAKNDIIVPLFAEDQHFVLSTNKLCSKPNLQSSKHNWRKQ